MSILCSLYTKQLALLFTLKVGSAESRPLIKRHHTKTPCCCLQSFWAFSQKKMGYSGVATFVRDDWSPVAAEIDCLGSFDADLNGEGR